MSDTPTSQALPACAPDSVAVARQMRRIASASQAVWLHQEVARRLAEKLEPIKLRPRSWIDWSAFSGGGLDVVQAHYPESARWVVEPTTDLAQASERLTQEAGRRSWRTLFRREAVPVFAEPVAQAPWLPGGVQMLWANMTLHASTDLPGMMAQWHRHLAIDGFLMCSGLGPDTARELRAVYRDCGWALPTIDFVDMHDLGDELVKAGFSDPVMDMETLTLTWDSAEALLDELRTWGGNVARGRHPGLRTRRWREQLIDVLNHRLKRPDGRLGLTVEVIYGHAVKPVPKAHLGPETKVSLDDMRAMIRRDTRSAG
ncbi:MAG TPA: biotin synthase [Aquabacterium sp.]|nr:biotin synthase [Aquabacterium sp.]